MISQTLNEVDHRGSAQEFAEFDGNLSTINGFSYWKNKHDNSPGKYFGNDHILHSNNYTKNYGAQI